MLMDLLVEYKSKTINWTTENILFFVFQCELVAQRNQKILDLVINDKETPSTVPVKYSVNIPTRLQRSTTI